MSRKEENRILVPGGPGWDEAVDFMRVDLESNMGLTRVETIARKILKEQGRDFNKEFEKWKQKKEVIC
jgi:hypothetical protein